MIVKTKSAKVIQIERDLPSSERDVTILATGAGITLIGRIIGRSLDAIIEIFLARLLGPTFFGYFAIGITLFRIVGTVGIFGLNNGVIRFGATYWRKSPSDLKSTLVYSIGFSILTGVGLGCLLYLLGPWLAQEVFNKPELESVFRLFAFIFPLAIGMVVASAATRITKRMKFSVIGEDLVQPAVNLLVLILLSLIGLKIGGAIISTAISYGFALLLLLFFVKNLFSDELHAPFSSNFAFRKLFIFSISTGLAGIFTLLTGWLSRLFIGYYRPAAEAGIYQAASQLSIIFVMILSSLNAIFAPMIADLYNKNELSRINELYKISTKWGLYVILPLFLVICFIPKDFIVAVFGENYLDGWLPLVILATSQVVNVATGAVGFLLIMTGHQYHWFRISFVTMLTNIILNIILVPRFGMVGTALATALSLGGLFVIGLIQTKRVLGLWPYDRRYMKGLISTGLATILLIVINPFISSYPPYVVVLICTVISYGSFWLGLLLLGIDSEDKELVRVFSTRLRNPRFLSSD